jgi:hypothetical protein
MTWKTIIGLKLQGAVVGCFVLAAIAFNFNRDALAILPLLLALPLTWAAHAVTKWDDFDSDSVIE